eukprot:m.313581 g.313581  ORF g.313581 m.313581 type:complete len:57 (+) comp405471_c0_seq1:25-195(+)
MPERPNVLSGGGPPFGWPLRTMLSADRTLETGKTVGHVDLMMKINRNGNTPASRLP